MSQSDFSKAELRAISAVNFPAFPINLRKIRDSVRSLLSEVGRYGFLDEYTTHSFEHVTGMLETVEWIIPEETKKTLTSADWLFVTLSIYFHDIGLLVSRSEFESRAKNPEFNRFKAEVSSDNEVYAEYWAKLSSLPPIDRDRVVYSEFVRRSHGARVRAWIEDVPIDDGEATAPIRKILHELLGALDTTAKKDLALLCESHTKDDIADTTKFKVSRPYGESSEECVNLQYVAVILRTVDLLQITRRRAPSVLYSAINPTDPISQLEWQKQGAVRSVRPSPGKDREGRVSAEIVPDTIEVHARFEMSDGFFGLTSYLAYVRAELTACHEAIKKSEPLLTRPVSFPWKYVDDSGVEAEGFLTEAFGFELDQHKILDLLTGHTLYNDTNVVLRELTQNALDAVRLQASIEGGDPEVVGRIDIVWDSKSRTLEVMDNGTGMSQSIIENHLLKVGSSRYQDPKFKERFPDFSSISRFGIGVLSAFMVADSVEITTCSPEDEHARQISLRSVHGKYLIKLLDKVSDRAQIGVYPHGSRVRLTLRSTASIENVLDIAKMWLLFPRCNVYVKVDESEAVRIGFKGPREALEHSISESAFFAGSRGSEFKVHEVSGEGVTMAYVLQRDELFKDWSFVILEEQRRFFAEDQPLPIIGTCVEGVGVDFSTPGFKGRSILAIANVSGKNAPKTNVARSALEDTSEYQEMLKKVYRNYARHVTGEIKRLSGTADYSLSRAVEQAPYIAAPLTLKEGLEVKSGLLNEALEEIPLVLVERVDGRATISLQELKSVEEFWTVDSPLTSSVEFFVREAPRDITASMILEKLQDDSAGLPGGMLVCNLKTFPFIEESVKKFFEPGELVADERARRVSVRWQKIGKEPRWISSRDIYREVAGRDRRLGSAMTRRNEFGRQRGDLFNTIFSVGDVSVIGLGAAAGLVVNRQCYLNPSDTISIFMKEIWLSSGPDRLESVCAYLLLLEMVRNYGIPADSLTAEYLDRVITGSELESFRRYINLPGFIGVAKGSKLRFFDPFAWRRRGSEED